MKVYNTLSGQKEAFVPQDDTIKMYVCGVTPYAPCHLGHAMSYIVFDTIRRYLEFRGYKAKYVQNFTDVDDKIIARANELGILPQELTEGLIIQYFADMHALNVKRADIYPRATEEIPKIIEVIEGLLQNGHAYPAGGNVYFRVRSDADYGKLSHRSLEGMMAGARIEIDEAKEHPLDFALWKQAKPGEPQWPSPWGWGRPGWHIECSAMSLKYLGETLDIHGGGQDLVFPHHENEIAQSESFTSVTPFVRYWLHNGLMQLGEDKMSKSSGKLIAVSEALAKYNAEALRLWVLSSHYRSPITYSEEVLAAMEKGVERLRNAAHVKSEEAVTTGIDAQPYRERFITSMDDDFGTPQAIAVLFDLCREINRACDEGLGISEAQKTFLELAEVLGLTLKEEAVPELEDKPFKQLMIEVRAKLGSVDPGLEMEAFGSGGAHIEPLPKTSAELIVASLVDVREKLRDRKKWEMADWIRSRLRELGITLEDIPQGTAWRYRKP